MGISHKALHRLRENIDDKFYRLNYTTLSSATFSFINVYALASDISVFQS